MRAVRQLILASVCVVCFAAAMAAAQDSASSLRDAAQQQFDRAETMRADLESQPATNRTEQAYLEVVQAYRRVYYTTAHAQEVPAAVFAVGSLYRAMGDRYDAKYYQSAVDAFQFLLHDYPTNRYREDALLAVGEIQRDDLHQPALAKQTFQEFLTLHPHSDGAAEAREALANIDADAQNKIAAPSATASAATTATTTPATHAIAQQTTRSIATADPAPPVTNASENETPTEVTSGGTGSAAASGTIAEVTRIQAWNADTYTRIVIDVGSPVRYQAARIPNPDRIYFDLKSAHVDRSLLGQPVDIQPGGFLKGVRVAQNQDSVVRIVLEVNQVKNYSVFLLDHPNRIVVDVYGSAGSTGSTGSQLTKNSATGATPQASAGVPSDAAQPAANQTARASSHATARTTSAAATQAAVVPAATAMPEPIAKTKKMSATAMRPPSIPEPMLDGEASLTRVLGLKVGRIVIDAGHGGHDTGTIGPTGLLEKDLCLDVALRLGALISQRLPGAEVIYTRDDDTFVPLEQRTEIATEAKADLFISIHANSSPDPSARGIETYYLNFTNSPAALEVAARENATYDGGVHDLHDMLQKIALNEKIDESRDLATDVQTSLSRHMERVSPAEKDRGVRTAPFVVLIGANIPSILAEIAFISNPTDEQMLKKPDARERVAEGLYQGVASYLQSTNSLTANRTQSEIDNAPPPLAQSGNRR